MKRWEALSALAFLGKIPKQKHAAAVRKLKKDALQEEIDAFYELTVTPTSHSQEKPTTRCECG